MPEIDFRYETKARKVMVDFKFDALYRYVSIESLLKSGEERSYPEVCIGGWSSACQPYIESDTALSDNCRSLCSALVCILYILALVLCRSPQEYLWMCQV